MRIWFDTEFIEDGRTIDLISIGMVREDGATYYAVNLGFSRARLFQNQWLVDNVLPFLPIHKYIQDEPWSYENSEDTNSSEWRARHDIRSEVLAFAGERPEFWGYYAAYDWVALCQLFGRMVDLPRGWPMFCRDVIQVAGDRALPPTDVEHHALYDALWTKKAWDSLEDHRTEMA